MIEKRIRISLKPRQGWMRWFWRVSSDLMDYESGLARTRERAIRNANRAAARLRRDWERNAAEEVWEFEEEVSGEVDV